MLIFAAISPHPPLLLPSVGEEEDKEKINNTLRAVKTLGARFTQKKIDKIIITSPHRDWGFNVPLHFIGENFEGPIEKILTGPESPRFYFKKGKRMREKIKSSKLRVAFIASGDLSHRLREDGPYGFHPQGPKFDEALVEALKKKKVEEILELAEKFPQAGECGLRSISCLLGVLDGSSWQAEILSYEGPLGVGYLVTCFKF